VIQQFLETGVVPVHKIQVSRSILIPAIAAIVPTSLLIITLTAVIFKTGKEGSAAVSGDSKQIAAIVTPEPVNAPLVSAPDIKGDTNPVPVQEVTLPPVQDVVLPPVKNIQVVSPAVKKTKSVSPDEERLIYLESLVEKGNLSRAIKQFVLRPVNDGAYYSLYARCLYESGEWEKAFEMSEKSIKVPSKRMPAQYRNGQFLLYKAKYHSFLFDNKKEHAAARAAITAWWDVREFFDGTAKATFAESEINRLSAFVGENGEQAGSQ
jgi:hypothetical protein